MIPSARPSHRRRTAAIVEFLECRRLLSASTAANPSAIPADNTAATGTAASVVILFDQATTTESGNLMQWTAAVQPAAGLTGAVPSGTVTFDDGGIVLGSADLGGGLATFATAALPVGTDSVTAVYNGDADYAESTSAGSSITVTGPAAGAPVLAAAIGRVSLPVAVVVGAKSKINLPVAIKNTGSAVEHGAIKINIYASTEIALDSDAVPVMSVPAHVSIKPGHGETITARLTGLPSTLASGSYHLLAQVVDATGFAQTAATAGAIAAAPPFVSPAVTIVKTPKSVPAGKKTKSAAVIRIANNGNVAIAETVNVTLYLSADDNLAGLTQTNMVAVRANIPAGKAASFSIPLGAIPSGFTGGHTLAVAVATPAAGDVAAASATAAGPNPVLVSATK